MHHATTEFSKAQTIRVRPEQGAADEALRFLALLGKDPATTRFRFFAHKENPRKAAIGSHKELGFNAERIAGHQTAGCGAYIVIADGGDDDASITSVPALFVEWDDKPLEWQRIAWQELGLPEPSLQVETGGKSLHTYWVLDQPLPPDQWRETIKRLIAHCGSDPAVKNPSRVMRLPGWDYIGADGSPTGRTQIVSAVGTRYTLEQVLANVPELPPKKAAGTSRTKRRNGSRSLAEIEAALTCIPAVLPNTGQRERFRALAWGLLHAVRDAGGSDADAEDLLSAHSPEVGDVSGYFNTEPHSITAASFWFLAQEAGWVPRSVLPELRPPDRVAAAGSFIANSCPIPPPEVAPLVALAAPMGAGKTQAIAEAVKNHRAAKRPAVVLTHRRSLGATLASELDLVWAKEDGGEVDAEDIEALQNRGIALCTDSLCPRSGMRFEARAWRGAVVVIDEVAQVLSHTLMATHTAVAPRRREVLRHLGQLLKHAAQVIVADAQLSEPVLAALEEACGHKALLIGSHHRPAAGRELVAHADASSWRLELMRHLEQRQRVWIACTAQQTAFANSAQNLAELVRHYWAAAKVLVADSATIADPMHPASQLAIDPNGIAAQFDVVIATPAVAAGLSVDKLPGHFAAVFGFFGGATDAAAAVQAVARVRDGCIRHVYAAPFSPGRALQMGSGATSPAELLEHLSVHEAQCVAKLLSFGWVESTSSVGPWLQLWGELAALQNRQRLDYAQTVLGLLKREGYEVSWHPGGSEKTAKAIGAELKGIAAERSLEEDLEVATAPLITKEEALHLKSERRRLTQGEAIRLRRWTVAQNWALGDVEPSPDVLEADRDGLHRRLRFGWVLLNQEGRSAAQAKDHEREAAQQGKVWAPDLCRVMEGPRIAIADLLRLPQWLKRREWFAADDPALLHLHATLAEHGAKAAQVLQIDRATRPITELENLLALAGYRLERKRRRCGKGKNAAATWFYRISRAALPIGASLEAMEAQWLAESGGGVHQTFTAFREAEAKRRGVYQKSPYKREDHFGTHRRQPAVGGAGWGAER